MKRFIEGEDRRQVTLLPDCLEDYVSDDNPVRVIEAFIDELDLKALGFEGVAPEATGRPSYHPAVLLKIYLYGYLNRIPSSRRLERETQRNIELMWLPRLGRERNASPADHVSGFFHDLGRKPKFWESAGLSHDGGRAGVGKQPSAGLSCDPPLAESAP